MTKTLHIAQPIGFCSGVKRALKLFEDIIQANPAQNVFVLNELVHNHAVTQAMTDKGAVFVQDVSQVPKGADVLIGAHGCGPSVIEECGKRHLTVHDATCPRVARLRRQMASCASGLPIIFLGDSKHPEVQGVLEYVHKHSTHDVYVINNCQEAEFEGWLPRESAAFFSQTTRRITEIAAVRAILARQIRRFDDYAHPCLAVRKRQAAMKVAAKCCERVYIVGSSHSSNAQRLAEIAKESGCPDVRFIEAVGDIIPAELEPLEHIGIGSATSSPNELIIMIIDKILQLGFSTTDADVHDLNSLFNP